MIVYFKLVFITQKKKTEKSYNFGITNLKELVLGTFYNTYVIGHYNPSVRIIDLVSFITYVVCVHFIRKWQDLQFKVGSERQIF